MFVSACVWHTYTHTHTYGLWYVTHIMCYLSAAYVMRFRITCKYKWITYFVICDLLLYVYEKSTLDEKQWFRAGHYHRPVSVKDTLKCFALLRIKMYNPHITGMVHTFFTSLVFKLIVFDIKQCETFDDNLAVRLNTLPRLSLYIISKTRRKTMIGGFIHNSGAFTDIDQMTSVISTLSRNLFTWRSHTCKCLRCISKDLSP